MNKPWLGYVAVALFILAGLFQIVAKKYVIGSLFIVLAIANLLITIKMIKDKK